MKKMMSIQTVKMMHVIYYLFNAKNVNKSMMDAAHMSVKKLYLYPLKNKEKIRKENPEIAAPLIHYYKDRLKPKLKEMKKKKNK